MAIRAQSGTNGQAPSVDAGERPTRFDPRLLESAYRAHADYVTRLAFLLAGSETHAEDICHEAFIRLSRAGGAPTADAQLRAYLRTTVVRLTYSSYRSRRRRERREDQVVRSEPTATVDERYSDVADAVWELPHRTRAAIVLRYWDDLTDLEIAEILGCRPATVRSLLRRGREQIREVLDDRRR